MYNFKRAKLNRLPQGYKTVAHTLYLLTAILITLATYNAVNKTLQFINSEDF